jgi:hypothetical protein
MSALQPSRLKARNAAQRGCPACKDGLFYAERQTPAPAPIKFDYRAITKEEERRFTNDFRGEGWEVGALKRLLKDHGWPKWAFDAAILHVLKTRTNPISYDDFLALARSVPESQPIYRGK